MSIVLPLGYLNHQYIFFFCSSVIVVSPAFFQYSVEQDVKIIVRVSLFFAVEYICTSYRVCCLFPLLWCDLFSSVKYVSFFP